MTNGKSDPNAFASTPNAEGKSGPGGVIRRHAPASPSVPRRWSFLSDGRRGVIALTALIMLSVMVVVALAASEEMALEAKAARNRSAIRQASCCAYTGIDYCIYLSRQSDDWRTALGCGTWLADYAVGGGAATVTATDPDDGAIAGNPVGVVQFAASGTRDLAKRTVTARAQPPPGEALRYALCCLSTKDLRIEKGVSVYGDVRTYGAVRATSDVSLAGNIYTAPGKTVEQALLDSDTSVVTTQESVAPPPVDFTWYQSVAEPLLLPLDGPNYVMTNARLTPTNNPFGFTHEQGLYYFNAGGLEVRIKDSYVIGSLIITNVKKVQISGGYCHKTHLTQYPALLADALIEIKIKQNLQESVAGVDFNADGDTKDLFVSRICGVMYSSGKIQGFQDGTDPGPFYVRGALVADELVIFGPGFHVSYDPQLAETAVAGFQGDGLVLIHGSIRR
jgi:hypothetical protein